ncbi:unnamed protein product [Chironomus riparius]|uniref:inositol-phosphate phosphatase n=1 Tax=Chironomus riparius TaxID=315576 RepID=A0A9N9RLC6_9DIPT|nr:unnamed protein product [Chironomus riparius]
MNLGGAVKVNKCAVITFIGIVLFIIYVLSATSSTIESLKKSSKNEVNLRKLIIGLILAAKSGGNQVIKISNEPDFGGVKTKGKTQEGVNDYITLADVNSHCQIAYSLWHIFPNLNLISEEDVQKKNCPTDLDFFDLDPSVLGNVQLPDIHVPAQDLTLWIDPLDATKEFTEKLFQYVSVMICVADKKGEAIAGVVYFPFSKRLYWSWRGHGVSENLANIKADLDDNVQNPIAIVSLSHAGKVKDLAKSMLGEKTSIIGAAGSGYKIVQVLEGNATIYLHNTRIKKWDLCAGNALINSVGGRMVTLKRDKISYSANSDHLVEDGLLVEINNHVVNKT